MAVQEVMMGRRRMVWGGLLLAGVLVPAMPDVGEAAAAVLQGLDKVTARISTIEAPIDTPVTFGSLMIVARTCQETPPEEPPESAAFLEITEIREDEESKEIFTGWMFASSPAVSALEHPVYDVWVIDCLEAEKSETPEDAEDAEEEG